MQIIVWTLRSLNVSNKFIFLFNNLRTEQNTSVGRSGPQDAQFCDSGLCPSSKAPGSSCEPFTSSPFRKSGVSPHETGDTLCWPGLWDSSVGLGSLAEFKGFALSVWHRGPASGKSSQASPQSCQRRSVFSAMSHSLSGEEGLREDSFKCNRFLLAASPWEGAELPPGYKGITSTQTHDSVWAGWLKF